MVNVMFNEITDDLYQLFCPYTPTNIVLLIYGCAICNILDLPCVPYILLTQPHLLVYYYTVVILFLCLNY